MLRRLIRAKSRSRSNRHVLPDPARIYDIQVAAFCQGHHLELIVVDQENCDLAGSHRFINIHEFGSRTGKLGRKLAKIGLGYLDASWQVPVKSQAQGSPSDRRRSL